MTNVLSRIITKCGWAAIEADPSLLCLEDAHSTLWPNQTVCECLNKLPKFTDLATTSDLDVMQRYADAHKLSLALGAFSRDERFGEIVRALFEWKFGLTPSIELLVNHKWPCRIEITLGPQVTVNAIYRQVGIVLKKWIRERNTTGQQPVMPMHEYFERLKWVKVDGRDVLVQLKCKENSICTDTLDQVRIMSTDAALNLTSIKQQVREHFTLHTA